MKEERAREERRKDERGAPKREGDRCQRYRAFLPLVTLFAMANGQPTEVERSGSRAISLGGF